MGDRKKCSSDNCSLQSLLSLNKGKLGTFYFTYENNNQWNAKVYKGILSIACCSHFVISDPQTGMRYLLLYKNLDYATFDEALDSTNDCS